MIIIDYIYLVFSIVPLRLKEEHLIAYLNACIAPIITLHNVFQVFFQEIEWELTWNGQVCMLEELLTQEFNPTETPFRIYITDAPQSEETYIFTTDEVIGPGEETYLWTTGSDDDPSTNPLYNDTWIYNTGEYGPDFIIHVPVGLAFSLERFTALVNKYKLPTKSYSIVYE